ncbi:hypothetical protein GQ53DRAFT_819112 [Thozetella sp. PMI_491]|nr:hypothetical protein GQ53DRAFT_819112 [Thozetella sp. PMI_491]
MYAVVLTVKLQRRLDTVLQLSGISVLLVDLGMMPINITASIFGFVPRSLFSILTQAAN